MFIYVITNNLNGKIYIGQHKGNNLKQYLQKKFYHARNQKTGSSYLFNAMRKHPNYRDWSIEPLMEVGTKVELDRLERLLIALYDTRNPEVGYNICQGGEGFTGTHTEEWKKNQSVRMKEIWSDLEYKVKTVEALRQAASTPERRAELSKATSKSWANPEFRSKNRAAIREATSKPDYRITQSVSQKQIWSNPEYRTNMSAQRANLFKTMWLDTEKRIEMSRVRSEVATKAWASPETRTRLMEGIRGAIKKRRENGLLIHKQRISDDVRLKVKEMRANGIKWREISDILGIPVGTASTFKY